MEKIIELLNSYSVILVIAMVMIIAFARSITKIFRMGATFKADLATKKELREFEEEMRRDMRAYCQQIQEMVTDAALTVINNKLEDIEDTKQIAVDMKVMKAELEAEMKVTLEKYEEIKAMSDSVRALGTKVNRLEMNNINSNSNERRSV